MINLDINYSSVMSGAKDDTHKSQQKCTCLPQAFWIWKTKARELSRVMSPTRRSTGFFSVFRCHGKSTIGSAKELS